MLYFHLSIIAYKQIKKDNILTINNQKDEIKFVNQGEVNLKRRNVKLEVMEKG